MERKDAFWKRKFTFFAFPGRSEHLKSQAMVALLKSNIFLESTDQSFISYKRIRRRDQN